MFILQVDFVINNVDRFIEVDCIDHLHKIGTQTYQQSYGELAVTFIYVSTSYYVGNINWKIWIFHFFLRGSLVAKRILEYGGADTCAVVLSVVLMVFSFGFNFEK